MRRIFHDTARRLSATLFAPRDIASLAVFRIAFGVLMLLEAVVFLASGEVHTRYIEPEFHFTYLGFAWVRPWPGHGMTLHFVVLGMCALGMALGWAYRLATALFCLAFSYVFLLDQAHYLNHFYLISLLSLLLCFVPADRELSIAVRRRPELRRDVVPGWYLWLLRTQLGLVYVYAGVAKLDGDWLRCQPLEMWLEARSHTSWLGTTLDAEWLPPLMSYGGLVFDLGVVPFLLWRKTRPVAFSVAIAFHLTNALVFGIGIFPWLMIASTTLFLEPDWPRRFRCLRLRRSLTAKEHEERDPETSRTPFMRRPWVVACLVVYLSIQVLVPLRHWVYPGPVAWTEEGHRFAWRMKLRSKRGWVRFTTFDPHTGESSSTDPANLLTDEQYFKMAGAPDMVLQFAHELARRRRQAGQPGVEVRARVLTSLNDRTPRLLIDPDVDLARIERSLSPSPWIVPFRNDTASRD